MDTTEALYILTRAVHDMDPTDSAVRDLLWQLEGDLRAQKDDPLQLRAKLDLGARHERTLAEVGS